MYRGETTGLFSINNGMTSFFKLRVAVLTCIFFVLANVLLAILIQLYYPYHTERIGFGNRLPNKFVLIRKELPSIFALMKKQMPAYEYNVVVLGDSVPYGSGNLVTNNETIGKYLEDNLKQKLGSSVRVWNLSIPGSKPGDTYFMYKKALELKPDLLIIDVNYAFFTPSNIKSPVSHKWLVGLTDPEGSYREPVLQLLNTNLEERMQYIAGDYLPIYKYRDVINGLLFQDYPGKKLQTKVAKLSRDLELRARTIISLKPSAPQKTINRQPSQQDSSHSKTQTNQQDSRTSHTDVSPAKKNEWYYLEWGSKLKEIAYMYNNTPIETSTNVAYQFTKALKDDLNRQEVPAVIFLAGQNQQLLKPLIGNKAYRDNIHKLDQLLAGNEFSYVNFDNKIKSELFTDNVHLTAEGNHLAADYLTELAVLRIREAGERK